MDRIQRIESSAVPGQRRFQAKAKPIPCGGTMYQIDILINTEVVKTIQTQSLWEARRLYRSNQDSWEQYTRLSVDGRPLTTGQAERFFQLGRGR